MTYLGHNITKGKPIKIKMAISILWIKLDLPGAAALLGQVALLGLVTMHKATDLLGQVVLHGLAALHGLAMQI